MRPQPLEPTDRILVDRVVHEGDERAFRVLYRRHTPYLFQLVLRLLRGNEFDAEDVIQEVWIRAVESVSGFRWEAELRSWLAGIALNLCRGLFRRKDRNWMEIVSEPVDPVSDRPDERLDLERALAALPDGYRAVLVLHDVEGYKHAEIARMLGTTEGTSKSQLFRARRTMRSLLAATEVRKEDHARP